MASWDDINSTLKGIVQNLSSLVQNGASPSIAVTTFSTLPASPSVGNIFVITDGPSGQTWGNTVSSGGGGTNMILWWNGHAWTILAQ